MIRYFSVLFTFWIFFPGISFPGDIRPAGSDSLSNAADPPKVYKIVEYDICKALYDGYQLLKAPAGFNVKDWLVTGMLLGGTAVSMIPDDEIRDVVRRNHTPALDDITRTGKLYGEVVPAVSLSAGIYAAGLIFEERSVSLTGRLLAESLLYAGTINVLLKFVFSRARPYLNKGNTDFWNFKFDNDYNSLPSGHTTVAFTVSTVLAERIDNIYASVGLYGLSALTAYQRIYSDNHWFSDTVLGAVIGVIIGHAIVKLNESDCFEEYMPEISVLPLDAGYAVGFTFRF